MVDSDQTLSSLLTTYRDHSITRKPTRAHRSALSTGILAIIVLTEIFSIVRHRYGVVFGLLYKDCHVNRALSARRGRLCVVVKSAILDKVLIRLGVS
jgi:hypothetical protein